MFQLSEIIQALEEMPKLNVFEFFTLGRRSFLPVSNHKLKIVNIIVIVQFQINYIHAVIIKLIVKSTYIINKYFLKNFNCNIVKFRYQNLIHR